MKREFIVHQHTHVGWETKTYKAATFEEAATMAVRNDRPWLADYKHSISFDDGRYKVTYEDQSRMLPFGHRQDTGDYWFGDKIREGAPDDCGSCGGTGINHYNPFMQCWACGDQKQKGRGTGKIGSQS